jgi:hypothetical protein
MVWAVSLSTMKLIPHCLTRARNLKSSILSLPRFGTIFTARIETVLYPWTARRTRLRLNAFRREPASSKFDWHFTPNHSSSANFSTLVGSNLHLVLPKLHSGHG